MPAYRSEATILEAVASVLDQTVGDLELLVIDDASPVPAAETLADVDDPRLGIVRHDRNRNTPAARNTALALARAPFVSQLDADDAWEPGYVEAMLPCFLDERIGLAYSNTHIVGHPDGLDDYIGDQAPHPIDTFPKLAEQNPVPALTATMRTSAVRAVGGYAWWLWTSTDYQLYAKLAAAGWRFAYVPRRLARYRWPSPTSKSWQWRKVELSELTMWLAFAARHPLTPGPRRQVRVRLRRELDRVRSRAAGALRLTARR